jgi:hypothetical protein
MCPRDRKVKQEEGCSELELKPGENDNKNYLLAIKQ